MTTEETRNWKLKELADETHVPERTIRFYIAKGLLDPPLRGGRDAAYGEKHKARLERIRQLQEGGMTLSQIGYALSLEESAGAENVGTIRQPFKESSPQIDGLADHCFLIRKEETPREALEEAGSRPASALPEPTVWRSYEIAPDVQVLLKTGAAPWRTKALLAALRGFADAVANFTSKEDR